MHASPATVQRGKKDLMEWMNSKDQFPPLMILRRYLKLIIEFCDKDNLMDAAVEDLSNQNYPFNIELVPVNYPKPSTLKMVV